MHFASRTRTRPATQRTVDGKSPKEFHSSLANSACQPLSLRPLEAVRQTHSLQRTLCMKRGCHGVFVSLVVFLQKLAVNEPEIAATLDNIDATRNKDRTCGEKRINSGASNAFACEKRCGECWRVRRELPTAQGSKKEGASKLTGHRMSRVWTKNGAKIEGQAGRWRQQ